MFSNTVVNIMVHVLHYLPAEVQHNQSRNQSQLNRFRLRKWKHFSLQQIGWWNPILQCNSLIICALFLWAKTTGKLNLVHRTVNQQTQSALEPDECWHIRRNWNYNFKAKKATVLLDVSTVQLLHLWIKIIPEKNGENFCAQKLVAAVQINLETV